MLELPRPARNRGWDPRVLAFRSGSTVSVFAVSTRRWTVIVDTLYSEAGACELATLALQAGARQAGGSAPPLLVVNTHSDWDHAWGNAVFAGLDAPFPAPVLGSRECARRLGSVEAASELATMRSQEPERFAGASLLPPTVTFDGEAVVDGGDLTLHLLPAPGHEPDQLVVWIPEIRVLLAADAAEHPMPFVQDLDALVGTLERMRDLRPRHVLASHDLLDGDPGLLDRNLAYFAQVREAAAAWTGETEPEDLEAALGLDFSRFTGQVPEDAWDFYRDAHRKALRAAVVERLAQ